MDTPNPSQDEGPEKGPVDVDLGVPSPLTVVIPEKEGAPMISKDDDVAMLDISVPVKQKSKTSTLFKLVAITILGLALLMVISSLVLPIERKDFGIIAYGNLYEDRPRVFEQRPETRSETEEMIPLPFGSPMIFSDYGRFTDSCDNFYLDSLHHLRHTLFTPFGPVHIPGDFIRFRLDADDSLFTINNIFSDLMRDFPLTDDESGNEQGEIPSVNICSDFGNIFCKVLVDTGNTRIAVLRAMPLPFDILEPSDMAIGNEIPAQSITPWVMPLNETKSSNEFKPTVIPVVHSEKAAKLIENQTNIRPEVIPHYCAHLGEGPNTEGNKGLVTLFPGKTEEFTSVFMASAEKAATNLDVAASIFHINTLEKELNSYKNFSNSIKAIVFPMRDVPEEAIHLFYCLGIPVFVPLIDVESVLESSGSAMRCNDTDDMTKEILHHTFYSEFPHVIHYGCFYELVEKLNEVDLTAVRKLMWEDNSQKNRMAMEKLKQLHLD